MKRLILVNNTMGVGKTATFAELSKHLDHNVFLVTGLVLDDESSEN